MILKTWLLSFIFILAAGSAVKIFAQKELYIKRGEEDYSIVKYMSILEDKQSKLTIQQAASDSMQNKYIYYNKAALYFGFTKSTYWVRLIVADTVLNPSPFAAGINTETLIIAKNDPIFEDVRLYFKNEDIRDNKLSEVRSGSIITPKIKVIKTNDYIGRFTVQKDVLDTVYLRLHTRSQFIVNFDLLTTSGYIIRSSQMNFFHGILFGIFFLLIAYNSLLYFSIKDKTYLYYVLYVLFFTLSTFAYEGYYFDVFGRTFTNDYFILPMGFLSIQVVFWILFTREILSIKTSIPFLYMPMSYLTIIVPGIDTAIYVFEIGWLTSWWYIAILVIFLSGFVLAIITLIKGVYISRYYLIALGGLIISILIQSVTRNGFLPIAHNIWTQNATNLGILWEALILAATVGYRFSHLRAEKEKEKSLMRSQIAADLHDEVGSYLSTISLQSRLMMNDLEHDRELNEQLGEISKIAGNTTETIRDIVWFINPFHDNSEEMLIRMKELASKMLVNINYTFNLNGNDDYIFGKLSDLNKRKHVYLIFKESLNNIIKHSNADNVSILLSIENNILIMVIADNGKGFDEEQIARGEGLNNLRNRAAQMGARILIGSNNGNGTRITLEVPL